MFANNEQLSAIYTGYITIPLFKKLSQGINKKNNNTFIKSIFQEKLLQPYGLQAPLSLPLSYP